MDFLLCERFQLLLFIPIEIQQISFYRQYLFVFFKALAAIVAIDPAIGVTTGVALTVAGAILSSPTTAVINEKARIEPLKKKADKILGDLEQLKMTKEEMQNAAEAVQKQLRQREASMDQIFSATNTSHICANITYAEYDPNFDQLKEALKTLQNLCKNYLRIR